MGSWKVEIETLLRNQMPYAFGVNGARGVVQEEGFSDSLGYVLDAVECLMKRSYFEGYASGGSDAMFDHILQETGKEPAFEYFDKDLSKVGAERAWLKWEQK